MPQPREEIVSSLDSLEMNRFFLFILISCSPYFCYLNWSERLLVMEVEKVLALEVDLVKSSITGCLWNLDILFWLCIDCLYFLWSECLLLQGQELQTSASSSQLFHDLLQMLLMVLGWVWSWH